MVFVLVLGGFVCGAGSRQGLKGLKELKRGE
jgi:hypothetical protein